MIPTKTSKINTSRLFLLPGIQLDDKLRKDFGRFGFVNTFLTCDQLSYTFNVVYLKFEPLKLDLEFYSFSKNMEKNPNFVDAIDLGHNQVVLVYRIPRRFIQDYALFLDGKYSKMSKEFQACFAMEDIKRGPDGKPIMDNGRFVKEPSRFFHIFNRTEWLKDRWKLRLYGDLDKEGNAQFSLRNANDAHLLDDMELFEQQNAEDEHLLTGVEIW